MNVLWMVTMFWSKPNEVHTTIMRQRNGSILGRQSVVFLSMPMTRLSMFAMRLSFGFLDSTMIVTDFLCDDFWVIWLVVWLPHAWDSWRWAVLGVSDLLAVIWHMRTPFTVIREGWREVLGGHWNIFIIHVCFPFHRNSFWPLFPPSVSSICHPPEIFYFMWMMLNRKSWPKPAVDIHLLNLFIVIIHWWRRVVPEPGSGGNMVMVFLLREGSPIDGFVSDWSVSQSHGLVVWMMKWMTVVDWMNLIIVLPLLLLVVVEVVWVVGNILHPLVDAVLLLHLFFVPGPFRWRKLIGECGILHLLWCLFGSFCFLLFLSKELCQERFFLTCNMNQEK